MTPTRAGNASSLAPAVLAIGALLAIFQACSLVRYEVKLTSVTVTPANLRMAGTTVQQLTATGRYSDDSERDVTAEAAWTSSDPAVATVSGGVVTPAQPGTTTITASMGQRSGSTTVTVTNALLQTIDVTPASASIANGTRQQFTATGHFDDGSAQDLTATVTWTSSDASLSVASGPASGGLATSGALGATTSTITAALGTISGSAALTVKGVTLSSVAVTPATATVLLGQTQQLAATGSFSDGSAQPMTGEVAWDTSAPSIATVAATGRATGVFAGAATITATSRALLGSVSGAAQLTVKTAGGGY